MTLEECIVTGQMLDDLKNCCTKSTVDTQFECITPPLFEIKPGHIVVDELHLLLVISDKLISVLIMIMLQLDHVQRTIKVATTWTSCWLQYNHAESISV